MLEGLSSPAIIIQWSPNGKHLVCATSDDKVWIWNAVKQSWSPFKSKNYPSAYASLPTRLYFSRDSQRVFAPQPSSSTSVNVYDVNTQQETRDFRGPSWTAFAMSRDRKLMAYGDDTGTALSDLASRPLPADPKRFDPPTRQNFAFHRFFRTGSPPACMTFSPNGRTLAVGWNGEIFLLDSRSNFEVTQLRCNLDGKLLSPLKYTVTQAQGSGSSVGAALFMEWAPNGRSIAVLTRSTLLVFDPQLHLKKRAPIPSQVFPEASKGNIQPGLGTNIVWSHNSKTLWTGGSSVCQWRASDLNLQRSLGTSGPVAVSPDETVVATSFTPVGGNAVAQWNIK